MVSRIIPVLDEPPVHVVASLGVQSNELGLVVLSPVSKCERLAVVAVLREVSNDVWTKPLFPRPRKGVDGDVAVRL